MFRIPDRLQSYVAFAPFWAMCVIVLGIVVWRGVQTYANYDYNRVLVAEIKKDCELVDKVAITQRTSCYPTCQEHEIVEVWQCPGGRKYHLHRE